MTCQACGIRPANAGRVQTMRFGNVEVCQKCLDHELIAERVMYDAEENRCKAETIKRNKTSRNPQAIDIRIKGKTRKDTIPSLFEFCKITYK